MAMPLMPIPPPVSRVEIDSIKECEWLSSLTWLRINENEWTFGVPVRGVIRDVLAEVYFDEERNPGWVWRLNLNVPDNLQEIYCSIAGSDKFKGGFLHTYTCCDEQHRKLHEACVELEKLKLIRRKLDEPWVNGGVHVVWETVPRKGACNYFHDAIEAAETAITSAAEPVRE